MKIIMKIIRWVDEYFEKYIGVFLISVMIILLFMQVISRYVFNSALAFTEEISLMLFVIFVYVGASQAIKKRQHLRITLLVNKLSPQAQKIMNIISDIIFAIALAFTSVGMRNVTNMLRKSNMLTVAVRIPKYLVYATILILFYIMILRLFQDIVKLIKEYKELPQKNGIKEIE